jgi:hypothetical protein
MSGTAMATWFKRPIKADAPSPCVIFASAIMPTAWILTDHHERISSSSLRAGRRSNPSTALCWLVDCFVGFAFLAMTSQRHRH